MTHARRLAELERELAPVVVAEILAVHNQGAVPLAKATRTVARAWHDDARAHGCGSFAAGDVLWMVLRIGAGIDAPEPARLRFYPR